MAEKLTFESGIGELEEIITRLEQGSISLDESFKAYEKAVKLSAKLKAILREGDARITKLTAEGETEFKPEAEEA